MGGAVVVLGVSLCWRGLAGVGEVEGGFLFLGICHQLVTDVS